MKQKRLLAATGLLCFGTVYASDLGISMEGDFESHEAPKPAAVKGAPVTPPPLREPDQQWIESTLASMTLEQKIGQMIMPAVSNSSEFFVQTYEVGGFVFLGSTSTTVYNTTTGLQSISDVPLLFAIDCEAGLGARLGSDATTFPMNMALAATGNRDYARQQGVVTARECRALGVHVGFGPVLDVNTEPINPIIGMRAFSDDPALVARMAEAYVEGAESAGLLTTFKHYPGHGGTEGDSHVTLPIVNITCDELRETHIQPYDTLIQKGLGDLVMSAHVWYPCLEEERIPATLSDIAMNQILREEIGFDRVIISDAFNMSGLQDAGTTREAAVRAVQSGLDIILMPPSVADAYGGILNSVNSGAISEARIDESVRRILRIKSRVGLPEATTIDPDARFSTVLHPDHIALSEEIGRHAIASNDVDPAVVPIDPSEDILVIGFRASSQIFYNFPVDSYFLNEIQDRFPNAETEYLGTSFDSTLRNSIFQRAEAAGKVIVATSQRQWVNSSSQEQLLTMLSNVETPVVFVSFGNPYELLAQPWMENYYSSFSSHYSSQIEMVDILSGDSTPQGDWPVTFGGIQPDLTYGDTWVLN